jgi:hypothetical protein
LSLVQTGASLAGLDPRRGRSRGVEAPAA